MPIASCNKTVLIFATFTDCFILASPFSFILQDFVNLFPNVKSNVRALMGEEFFSIFMVIQMRK